MLPEEPEPLLESPFPEPEPPSEPLEPLTPEEPEPALPPFVPPEEPAPDEPPEDEPEEPEEAPAELLCEPNAPEDGEVIPEPPSVEDPDSPGNSARGMSWAAGAPMMPDAPPPLAAEASSA